MSLKRCVNCRNFYESEQEECWYHPGIYVDPVLNFSSGANVGWSCCRFDREQLVNRKALSRHVKGCAHSDFHVEDEELTEMMKIASGEIGIDRWAPFEMSELPRAPSKTNLLHLPERPTTEKLLGKEEELTELDVPESLVFSDFSDPTTEKFIIQETTPKPTETKKPEPKITFHEHIVKSNDTLFKLSLLYDVSVEAIRAANMISASNNFIQHRKSLRIPISEDAIIPPEPIIQSKRDSSAIKRFILATNSKMSEMEANFYLEEADWNVTEALQNYRVECAWETENRREIGEGLSLLGRPRQAKPVRTCC
mmetsp:Transcript_24689/g.33960  ORF Transcript_24689/g.33960 Transcript_24689/m.33960 type:complete len:310 (+) Transcript_24689:157-1086(+)|eukprot:CAMPEP_0201488860 /NCGR_PEP_ID=MMETSP0151_2-20130828/19908_1 /ASSEMBLY_ACC=CAM_ASM_000257 /TAXON_ID=200890 /ORGANISM="Paramoeba atlantica, Strain 621/1 / CCAP 1560/9" /LENGTH=309 /DNA_ID=CAMNT_0047874249 /DNA_START=152 /DNA_END=1081 /DNA_ORIENTATION=+